MTSYCDSSVSAFCYNNNFQETYVSFFGKIRLLSFQDFVFLATNWAIHATFPAHRCKIDPEVEKAKRVEELNQLVTDLFNRNVSI